MTRVLLVRHGTTAWNTEGRLQGWADVELADVGHREAADVGAAIATTHDVSRVVSSPLRRAVQTAEAVADRVEVESVATHPGWRERSFGAFEGERADVVFDAYPEIHPKSESFVPTECPPGGESASTVVDRVRDCWNSTIRQRRGDDETVVVVTHETPLRVVAGLVDGDGPVDALRRHAFEPGTVVAIDGLAEETDPEWSVFEVVR